MPGMPSTPLAVEIGAIDGIDLAQVGPAADRVLLPAEPILDDVADLEARIAATSRPRPRAAGHHLAEADRRGVGRGVAHAAALVGIEREIVHLAPAPRRACGSGTGTSSTRKSDSAGSPGGRRTSTTRRWVLGMLMRRLLRSGFGRHHSAGPERTANARSARRRFLEAIPGDVERRQEQQREQGGDDDAADHGDRPSAPRTPRGRSGSCRGWRPPR